MRDYADFVRRLQRSHLFWELANLNAEYPEASFGELQRKAFFLGAMAQSRIIRGVVNDISFDPEWDAVSIILEDEVSIILEDEK